MLQRLLIDLVQCRLQCSSTRFAGGLHFPAQGQRFFVAPLLRQLRQPVQIAMNFFWIKFAAVLRIYELMNLPHKKFGTATHPNNCNDATDRWSQETAERYQGEKHQRNPTPDCATEKISCL